MIKVRLKSRSIPRGKLKATFRKKFEAIRDHSFLPNKESKADSYTTPYIWYYIMLLKGIQIQGIKSDVKYPYDTTRQGSLIKNYRNVFFNEVEYPYDVLLEFSDLGVGFWDPDTVARKNSVITYDEIKRKGFFIVSSYATHKVYKSQRVVYLLWKKGTTFPRDSQICNSKPSEIVIILDQLHNRIRLQGPNCYFPTGYGFWHKFTESPKSQSLL